MRAPPALQYASLSHEPTHRLHHHAPRPLRSPRRLEVRVRGGDPEGVPQAVEEVPPGPQPRRQAGRRDVQGGADAYEHPQRPDKEGATTTSSASPARDRLPRRRLSRGGGFPGGGGRRQHRPGDGRGTVQALSAAGGGGGRGFDLGDLFGGGGGGGRAARSRRPAAEPIEAEVTVPFDVAANGGSVAIESTAGRST